ncbi:GNAT family N-acetyltransferase [Photobacterium nomapromontoriensis]|uniref:GNAT family N-acetyltransferase n=1 Tax=Photobacterium nomapromontoriensis TaxID=2910237 RepID=UPI003D0D5EE2
MNALRYQLFTKDECGYVQLTSHTFKQEAIIQATIIHEQNTEINFTNLWLYDSEAQEGSYDVFRFDCSGLPCVTGHKASAILNSLALTSVPSLALAGIYPAVNVDNCVVLLKSLAERTPATQVLGEDYLKIQAVIDENQTATAVHRQYDDVNELVLEVLCQGELIAVAMFSRYVEDHRFPTKSSELYYEISLHSIYVQDVYRGRGLAAALSELLVNIVRKDSEHILRQLSCLHINLKLWFSALAITPGGEAICDWLSEAIVDMTDDVVDELLDEGLDVHYQEPMIFVDSLF